MIIIVIITFYRTFEITNSAGNGVTYDTWTKQLVEKSDYIFFQFFFVVVCLFLFFFNYTQLKQLLLIVF